MKTIFSIQAIGPKKGFQWTTRRGANKVNHRYNKRRQTLTQLLAFIESIQMGELKIEGLSVDEQKAVRVSRIRHCG